jgi:hypothetical protein
MIHLFYNLAPSARQDRSLRHFLKVQRAAYAWMKSEFSTYPDVKGKVIALGKAFTAHKKTMPDWNTVYSTPIRQLIYNCFYAGHSFNSNSIYFPQSGGWKFGDTLTVSKVTSTIEITKWPILHSYGPRIRSVDIGTPTTLKLILTDGDEWRADVGMNTGDRIIATSSWNGECARGCDEYISIGDLVEKADVRDHDEVGIEEPRLAWCHLDCQCPACGLVWPACDGHDEDDYDDSYESGDSDEYV